MPGGDGLYVMFRDSRVDLKSAAGSCAQDLLAGITSGAAIPNKFYAGAAFGLALSAPPRSAHTTPAPICCTRRTVDPAPRQRMANVMPCVANLFAGIA